MKRILLSTLTILFIIVLLPSCKSVNHEKEITDSLVNLPAEEILKRGEEMMQQEKFRDARIHFRFLYENFPNSPSSIQALIGLADSLYEEGGLENIVRAKVRYQDFYNRFPQAEQAEHALFMLGATTFYQHKKPFLDTKKTREALASFDKYLKLFPEGKQANKAQDYINQCKEILAEHEYYVANHYFKRKIYAAALSRIDFLEKTYPGSNAAAEGLQLKEKIETARMEAQAKRDRKNKKHDQDKKDQKPE